MPGIIDTIEGLMTHLVKLTDSQIVQHNVDHIRVLTLGQANATHDDLLFGPTTDSDETDLEQPQASHEEPVWTSTCTSKPPNR